jgi:RAT1-interacting protein
MGSCGVTQVGDTLYIEEVVTAASLADKAAHANNERQRTMAYHGYAFESFCTAPLSDDKTSAQPDADGWSGDVNTNEQWCEIVRTSLGGHGVLIGGETDCVIESHGGNEAEGVELKTSMVLRNQRDEVRFEKKMLRFCESGRLCMLLLAAERSP